MGPLGRFPDWVVFRLGQRAALEPACQHLDRLGERVHTAPIPEAQLAETVLLNHITFQTGIATKAARCVLAADGAELVDFSFRRTQGIEAGLAVARASAIAGFSATSSTEAARRYGLTAAGTMAHSYVEARNMSFCMRRTRTACGG